MLEEERPWLRRIPEGVEEIEATVLRIRTDLGPLGFRHFEVSVEGGRQTFPGSHWDSDRKVWWARLKGKKKIAVWEGNPPPEDARLE